MTILHVPSKRAVLVPARDVPFDLGIKGRPVKARGDAYVAFRHTYENTLVLRALGLPVDSPMMHGDFEFVGSFRPFRHQRITAAFLSMNRRAFCFSEMGTGKTAASIWAAEYMRRIGLIRRILVVAPLTTLRDVWVREIENCAPGVGYVLVRGDAETRRAAIRSDAPWLIVNHDGIKSNYLALLADNTIDHVICDESTAFKTPSAERTKLFSKYVLHREKGLWAMTGTPMAKLPTDVYSMAKLVCPSKVPTSFGQFQDMTCLTIGLHKVVPKRGAVDRVLELLEPAIRFEKRECIDLPPITFDSRKVEASPEQEKIIKDLQVRFMAEVGGKKITALTAATQMTKVLQVLQGGIITNTETQEGRIIGAPSRLAALIELIHESNSKTIVFAPYRLSLQYLMEKLGPEFGAGFIDGTVTEKRRAEVLRRFATDDKMRVLIAQPRTASHGLTMTSASTIVWWGPVFSAEEYTQANNRIDRPGQKHHMSVYNLYASPYERKFYLALKERLDMQALLLAAVAEM
jgi:SNF2 family DNA or RNA helicase